MSQDGYTIYGIPNCQYCVKAKMLLNENGNDFKYVEMDKCASGYPEWRDMIVKTTRQKTFPFVYDSGYFVGGFTDLVDYLGKDDIDKNL